MSSWCLPCQRRNEVKKPLVQAAFAAATAAARRQGGDAKAYDLAGGTGGATIPWPARDRSGEPKRRRTWRSAERKVFVPAPRQANAVAALRKRGSRQGGSRCAA